MGLRNAMEAFLESHNITAIFQNLWREFWNIAVCINYTVLQDSRANESLYYFLNYGLFERDFIYKVEKTRRAIQSIC